MFYRGSPRSDMHKWLRRECMRCKLRVCFYRRVSGYEVKVQVIWKYLYRRYWKCFLKQRQLSILIFRYLSWLGQSMIILLMVSLFGVEKVLEKYEKCTAIVLFSLNLLHDWSHDSMKMEWCGWSDVREFRKDCMGDLQYHKVQCRPHRVRAMWIMCL